MKLTTFLSAAATVTTASAGGFVALGAAKLNSQADMSKPHARVINNCNYPVHLWSVCKGQIGCPSDTMVTLKKGQTYAENYQEPDTPGEGVSIKISKTKECKNDNIVQLEYFLERRGDKSYQYNYLDVSYVDCTGGDCPTKKEGYYLSAGDSSAKTAKIAADGSWCPTLSCSDAASCAKCSYILHDDDQTKTCDLNSSMEFYMCGKDGSSGGDYEQTPASSAPASVSSKVAASSINVETPSSKPATTLVPVVSSAADYKIKAAAVTNAPRIDDAIKEHKVKTKVVYVTAYEYVNAKRREHAHAHARRHQPFNA